LATVQYAAIFTPYSSGVFLGDGRDGVSKGIVGTSGSSTSTNPFSSNSIVAVVRVIMPNSFIGTSTLPLTE